MNSPDSSDEPTGLWMSVPTALPETTMPDEPTSLLAGAKLRLGIMAFLAIVVLLGTFRGGAADGESATIDLSATAAARDQAVASASPANEMADAADEALSDEHDDADGGHQDTPDVPGAEDSTGPELQAPSGFGSTEDGDGEFAVDLQIVVPDSAKRPTYAEIIVAACAAAELTKDADCVSPFYADGFEVGRSEWNALSGDWKIVDGTFVQANTEGYDLIVELGREIPRPAKVAVKLRAVEGHLGGGLMVAQPAAGSRNGATAIDIIENGRFLRWGNYDEESGSYSYLGGVSMPATFDPTIEHQLSVESYDDRTIVRVDGVELGRFGPLAPGQVGLLTSISSVAFDNFTVTELSD